MEERLRRVLDAHRLPCGAIIGPEAEVVAQAGDFVAFASAGLVSAILGPYGSTKSTYSLVQDSQQIKPVMWGQGGEFAFLDRAGELVVVVFGRDGGDAYARYALSRLVSESIAVEFAGEASP